MQLSRQDEIAKLMLRYFQSGHINFILGSGASVPAIPPSGDIESRVDELVSGGKQSEADRVIYSLLSSIQAPCNLLIENGEPSQSEEENAEAFDKRKSEFIATKSSYRGLLELLEKILNERKTSLLPKQANLFTTNYDLFIEEAALSFSALRLNDGFLRNPNLKNEFKYSPQVFSSSVLNRGNLYDYTVEIPTVNLIKIHGSLSWIRQNDEVFFRCEAHDLLPSDSKDSEVKEFLSLYSIILPQQAKFRQTLLDRIYYDLLRIYSNELDKENSLLVAFGFSFEDRHILEITKRALKNSTLSLVISAYEQGKVDGYLAKFAEYNNVLVLDPGDTNTVTLADFNTFVRQLFDVEKKK